MQLGGRSRSKWEKGDDLEPNSVDITDGRAQQEALRTSEETFRSAMYWAPIGMALVALTGRLLKVNPALCRLLGYGEEELLSLDFQSITHPDDLEQDLDHVRQLVSGDVASYQMEKRYFSKSGRVIWAQLNVSMVQEHAGVPGYFISQIQDISSQKEIERMKSDFISMVSHEMRTPLTSIRGSLGLMTSGVVGELGTKAAELTQIAYHNTERLILLLNDILDIDKIESGGMRFEMKDYDVSTLVHQALEMNSGYGEKFGVHFVLEPCVSSPWVSVDQNRFIQVLSNLLSNAAKYSSPDDDVRIIVSRRDRKVRVTVTDMGPGIPDEFRSRIFSKFAQADATTARAKGGTGLGLNISKEMIEHMNGEIGFDSDIGKGTSFWVALPEIVDENVVTIVRELGRRRN